MDDSNKEGTKMDKEETKQEKGETSRAREQNNKGKGPTVRMKVMIIRSKTIVQKLLVTIIDPQSIREPEQREGNKKQRKNLI